MRGFLLTAAVALSAGPAMAQQTQPSLANAPDIVQWQRIDSSMSELLQQGYRGISVNQVITNPPIQDLLTTYYLSRASEMVRCQEGVRLLSERYWVTSCARITKPYELKNN